MLTQEIVKEHIHYDPQTGVVTWIKPRARRVKIGDTVDCLSHGYIRIVLFSKYYQLHRVIFLYMMGRWPNQIDHIDLNRSNNKWDNLRESTQSENMCNTAIPKNNKSGVKGVYWDTGRSKWGAQIQLNGKCVYSKWFETLEEAKLNIEKVRENIHGEYTRHE